MNFADHRTKLVEDRLQQERGQVQELVSSLITKYREQTFNTAVISSRDLPRFLKCIRADVDAMFKCNGFAEHWDTDVVYDNDNNRINITAIERSPVKLVSINTVPVQKPETHYDKTLKLLVLLYGEQLGKFLTNRLAGLIRKNTAKDSYDGITNIRVCLVGDSASEKAYALQKHQGHGKEYEQAFEYTDSTGQESLYLIGFNCRGFS